MLEAVEYPSFLQIETTNRCNARCSFCYYRFMKRPNSDMTDELFVKVVQDAKALRIPALAPFLNGEMFMDKKIFDRLQYINQELPGAGLDIFTNASLLNEEKIRRLSSVKNIRRIHCSFNASNAEEYTERVGLNFEQTHQNIKTLIEFNRTNPFTEEIKVLYVELGKGLEGHRERSEKFEEMVRAMGGVPQVSYKYNYLGVISSKRPVRNVRCPRLNTVCVLSNGIVALCCMDMEGDYPLGDANKQNLLEIYNGNTAREYRRGKKFMHEPCKHCNMI